MGVAPDEAGCKVSRCSLAGPAHDYSANNGLVMEAVHLLAIRASSKPDEDVWAQAACTRHLLVSPPWEFCFLRVPLQMTISVLIEADNIRKPLLGGLGVCDAHQVRLWPGFSLLIPWDSPPA